VKRGTSGQEGTHNVALLGPSDSLALEWCSRENLSGEETCDVITDTIILQAQIMWPGGTSRPGLLLVDEHRCIVSTEEGPAMNRVPLGTRSPGMDQGFLVVSCPATVYGVFAGWGS